MKSSKRTAAALEIETSTTAPHCCLRLRERANKAVSSSSSVVTPSQDTWILPLCISHCAAAWGERSWEFGAGLLLLQLNTNTDNDEGSSSPQHEQQLRLTAILVLAECFLCSLCGPNIGRAMDGAPSLLGAALLTLAIQSAGIAAAAALLQWAFVEHGKQQQQKQNDENKVLLLLAVTAIASSVLARLASLGSTLAVEKQWATALSHHTQHCYGLVRSQEQVIEETTTAVGNEATKDVTLEIDGREPVTLKDEADEAATSPVLSKVNAKLRCIDLTCNLCAPIAVGFLLESTSPATAAMSIAAFNVLAWPVEVACLCWIHGQYRQVLSSSSTKERTSSLHLSETSMDDQRADNAIETSSLCETWRLYYRQPIFRSALALAVLYFSVVSFGTIMTAWFAASGFHAGHLGAARAVAALSGMLSTVTTPRLVPKLGVERTGLWYIWYMWSCILPCTVAAFCAFINPNFLWIIVISVIVSRFGLWGFDLCVTQMLQERIEPMEKIGEVNGTQVALQNAFDALAALICVLLPNPDTFAFLILGSFGSVTIAALLHTCQYKNMPSTRRRVGIDEAASA